MYPEPQVPPGDRRERTTRQHREAARQLLAECRHELREALASPEPDPTAVLELSLEERLLLERLEGSGLRARRDLARRRDSLSHLE